MALLSLVGVLLVVVLAGAAVATAQAPKDVVLVGAGDIVACGGGGAFQTAALLAANPGTVFTLGDNAYPTGSSADFSCFDQSWGHFKAGMLPVVGNHEYQTPGAAGYFTYFGAAAAPPYGYYAVNEGSWRIYVLNSECSFVSCAADSPQLAWLRAELAADDHECVLAMWHEPRFSTGPHEDLADVGPFWDALYAAGAELILNGHDHVYERYLPMDPDENVDPTHGMIEIVAGTGGIGGVTFATTDANLVVGNDQTFGILKLTLRAHDFDWQFIPVAGKTFTDSGSASCHGRPTPPFPTSPPSDRSPSSSAQPLPSDDDAPLTGPVGSVAPASRPSPTP